MLRSAGFEILSRSGGGSLHLPPRPAARSGEGAVYPHEGMSAMIEAAMIWNEPNNKSHWDPEIDPDWRLFAEMAICAGGCHSRRRIRRSPRVLGGMSPIDPLSSRT